MEQMAVLAFISVKRHWDISLAEYNGVLGFGINGQELDITDKSCFFNQDQFLLGLPSCFYKFCHFNHRQISF